MNTFRRSQPIIGRFNFSDEEQQHVVVHLLYICVPIYIIFYWTEILLFLNYPEKFADKYNRIYAYYIILYLS